MNRFLYTLLITCSFTSLIAVPGITLTNITLCQIACRRLAQGAAPEPFHVLNPGETTCIGSPPGASLTSSVEIYCDKYRTSLPLFLAPQSAVVVFKELSNGTYNLTTIIENNAD